MKTPFPLASLLRLSGLGLAGAACFALGWQGYRLLQPSPGPALPGQVLQPSALPSGPVPGAPVLPPAASPLPDTVRTTTASSTSSTAVALTTAASSHPALIGLAAAPVGERARLCLAGGSRENRDPADPSNYGERQALDWKGAAVLHTPSLIVLHETVVDEPTALALFRRHNSDDGQQASYHVLIAADGRRIRVVDDDKRAFGAGDSAFQGQAVQLRQEIPASVNNFALHVSLVSPPDGADGEKRSHTGYSPAQYASLARQIALWQSLYRIPASQIATHQEVDRSGTRHDPRSFDWSLLGQQLRSQLLACSGPSPVAQAKVAAKRPSRP